MEKLAEHDPELPFPINIHLIPGIQQSMTIGAARKLHKELGEILKKILSEDLETKNTGDQK